MVDQMHRWGYLIFEEEEVLPNNNTQLAPVSPVPVFTE